MRAGRCGKSMPTRAWAWHLERGHGTQTAMRGMLTRAGARVNMAPSERGHRTPRRIIRMHGVLNLNKPAGVTSRRVVDQVQRLVRPGKAGHAGTLDPLATGVLVVAIGSATRLISYVQQMPKRYLATFLLGYTSSTEDIEGEMHELPDVPQPTLDAIRATAAQLTGTFEQTPPVFSALKVAGRRAYALARRGEHVELAPRPVTVYAFDVLEYAYPHVVADIRCTGGTYVRSLGRDLGEQLGTGAVMAGLERTAVGQFTVEEAIAPDRLTPDSLLAHLQPPVAAVTELPRVVLSASELEGVSHGRTIFRDAVAGAGYTSDSELAAVDSTGRLVAILTASSSGQLAVHRFFPA